MSKPNVGQIAQISSLAYDDVLRHAGPLLFGDTDALIAIYDPNDRLRYANAAFRETFFIDDGATPTWLDFMRANSDHGRGILIDVPDFECWLRSAVCRRGKLTRRSFETALRDGRWLWVVETVMDNNWMLHVGSDITEMHAGERRLRRDRDHAVLASQTDDLTSISNRRFIMKQLDDLISADHQNAEQQGCACLLDLDHFKAINDAYGHQAGDDVLIGFARLVQDVLRLCDGFGRVGGEEFLVTLPGTPLQLAQDIIARIYEKVRVARFISQSPEARVTFSAGMTVLRSGDTVQAAYRRCDAALYRAKAAGRDRLVIDCDGPALT